MKKGMVLFGVLLLAGGSAMAADGPALYKEHCAKCHGETGHADSWRGYMTFARNFTNAKWQARMSDADLLEQINRGPRIMPSYQNRLSDEEKKALLLQIRSYAPK